MHFGKIIRVCGLAAETVLVLGLGLSLAGQVWAADTAPSTGGTQGTSGLAAIKSGVTKTAGGAGLGSTSSPNLETVIGLIINSVLSLVGIILLGYMIYGGFRWMTAGGDAKAVTEAQAIMKNAVIGIIIIALSYLIADWVLRMLISASSGTVQTPATK